ncbi:MAG: hypothetical protein LBD30_04310 [Verrucomicrobiales bacterium]|jgi:hypothetical protein|nr:hypothetical protein [Verrucomicrobiales bacterium]
MALAQFNPQMSGWKKATLILMLPVSAAGALWLFISGDIGYADSLARRDEKDFVVKEYTVGEVGERAVRERARTLFSYVFIKPAGADFDLSVSGNSNAFSNGQNAERNARLGQIKTGGVIRVKVFAPELAAAERNNPWLWLKRFATADRREVEIYRLEKDGAIIVPDADIHHSDKLSRQGGKLAATRVTLLLAVAAAALYLIGVMTGKLRKRQAK